MKSSSAYVFPVRLYKRSGRALLKKWKLQTTIAADALETAISANSSGVHSHGLVKLVSLLETVIRIDPQARPVRLKGTAGAASTVWDGKDSLSPTVFRKSVEDIVAALQNGAGIAMSSVTNGTHFLMPWFAIKYAIKHDIIMIVMATAARSEVVALGGERPSLGTNPITIVVPHGRGQAVIIDCATSALSFGKLTSMRAASRRLPSGSAVDAAGRLTIDPKSAVAPVVAGRLGFGLSLAIESIAALIGGSRPALRGEFDQGGKGEKHNCCFFTIGIKPSALSGRLFAGKRTQRRNLLHVLESIKSDGGGSIRFPGERRFAWAKLAKKNGGPLLPEAQARQLVELSRAAGVEIRLELLKKVRIPESLLQ